MSQHNKNNGHNEYAIVGLSCRFPNSQNYNSFWQNLLNGIDCVRPIESSRWNSEYFTKINSIGKIPTSRVGWIENVNVFDSDAFSISLKETANMDPQQKLLLEVSMEALEDAGYQYKTSKTGVFVGIGQAEQLELTTYDLEAIDAYAVTGSALSIASNRLSYIFDLRGPSLSVDTACSSSLTALHQAINSLNNQECEYALVGGVNLLMNPSVMIQFAQLGVLSPEGRCASFDASANGYVRGEGCGMMVIMNLNQAINEGHHIYAIIKGAAINSDGHLQPSLTMPSGEAQYQCFKQACQNSGVEPSDLDFVEAHATGTKVGDPIEANAIGSLVNSTAERKEPLYIGSVKSNIGHLETASFMAGLFKVIGEINHGILTKNLYYKSGNPSIKFDEYKLKVVDQEIKLDHKKLSPLRAMVTSFGFGGSNGAAIIESYEQKIEYKQTYPPQLLIVSANTIKGVEDRINQLKKYYENNPQVINQIRKTLYERQLHRYYSFSIKTVTSDLEFSPIDKISELSSKRPIIWVFAGQGPQHPLMGKRLFDKNKIFRQSILESDSLYQQISGISLIEDQGLFGEKSLENNFSHPIYQLETTLPGLVILQIALVDLYKSLGLNCDCVFGHSFGEMAAGYAAGLVTRKNCIETAYHRAKILTQLDGVGVMMAVGTSASSIKDLLNNYVDVWIAAYNSPSSITLGGKPDSIKLIGEELKKQGIFNRILKINNAYHTPLLEPCKDQCLQAFSQTLADVEHNKPICHFISTVTGKSKESHFDADYAWSGIVSPVQFEDAMKVAIEKFEKKFGDQAIFIEFSAHPVLTSYMQELGAKQIMTTLHREQDDFTVTLKNIVRLRSWGIVPKLDVMYEYQTPRLPQFLLYPFKGEYHVKEDAEHKDKRLCPHWSPMCGKFLLNDTPNQPLEAINKLHLNSFVWIPDHVVQDTVVFPAAGYIETALEFIAKKNELNQSNNKFHLSNIIIGKALVIPNDAFSYRKIKVQNQESTLAIYSKNNSEWVEHMSCYMSCQISLQDNSFSNQKLSSVQTRCSQTSLSQKELYQKFTSIGLSYGPYFQSIDSLYPGNNECWAELKPAISFTCLLDNCFQVLLGARKSLITAYVPTKIAKLIFLEKVDFTQKHYVTANIKTYDPDNINLEKRIRGDIILFDVQQNPIGSIQGFEATALNYTEQVSYQSAYKRIYQTLNFPSDVIRTTECGRSSDLLTEEIEDEKLCLDLYIFDYLHNFFEKTDIKSDTVSTWPKHRQLYWDWISGFYKSEKIKHYGSTVESLGKLGSLGQVCNPGTIQKLSYELEAINRVGQNLEKLLEDTYSVQSIFFDPNDPFMTDLYAKSLTFAPQVNSLTNLVSSQLKKIDEITPRVYKILEIGSGTGALSKKILAQINQETSIIKEKRLTYTFTDVSSKFLSDGKNLLKDYDCVEYELFNLDNEVKLSGEYDIILAYDVLHVCQDIKSCLQKIRSMLVPNGLLLAIELTNPSPWIEFFFGLFSGWGNYTVRPHDQKRCWLKQNEWGDVLENCGFHSTQFINHEREPNHSIIASHNALLPTKSNVTNQVYEIFDGTQANNDNHEQLLKELLEKSQKLISTNQQFNLLVLISFDQSNKYCYGSSLVGFTRVLINEQVGKNHKIAIICLDAQELSNIKAWTEQVICLLEKSSETEFYVRQNQIFTQKFLKINLEQDRKYEIKSQDLQDLQDLQANRKFRAEINQPGDLSTINFHAHNMPDHLADDEVEVEVYACALNFKDLLLALNMLDNPLDENEEIRQFKYQTTPLGLEFSGVIIKTGVNVKDFKVGDEVYGFGSHCIASHVRTKSLLINRKPKYWSHEEACSIPIVFATAYAGLIAKANLQEGEKVLIHSAAGGVGQAAIQICKIMKAEIIATVGSQDKEEFLRNKYSIKSFANSHDPYSWTFEKVDVVLNSLKEEAIEQGLKLLNSSGRFVEIGKVDMLNHHKLDYHTLLQDISLHSVQLDILLDRQPHKIHQYMKAIQDWENKISPFVDKVFDLNNLTNAFRYLQSGKHKGKIVIKIKDSQINIQPSRTPYDPNICAVITGGLGALGLSLFEHLAKNGIKQFILISRRHYDTLDVNFKNYLKRLKQNHQIIAYVACCDIIEEKTCSELLLNAKKFFKQLNANFSIYHLAMVLDDDPIPKLTGERMKKVIGCKVDGLINLLNVLPSIKDLILFSSASSVFGNPSQSNYAAANAFLDDLTNCKISKISGKIISLNLGSVENVGILSENTQLREILRGKGFHEGLTSHSIMKLLDRLHRDDQKSQQILYGNFQYNDLIESFPSLRNKFEHLVTRNYTQPIINISDDSKCTVETLSTFLLPFFSAKTFNSKDALTNMGMDSLLAVEISNSIKKKFNIKVTQMQLLGGLSVEDIVKIN